MFLPFFFKMLTSVKLYNKLCGSYVEINYVWSNRILSVGANTNRLEKIIPKMPFFFCHFPPKPLGVCFVVRIVQVVQKAALLFVVRWRSVQSSHLIRPCGPPSPQGEGFGGRLWGKFSCVRFYRCDIVSPPRYAPRRFVQRLPSPQSCGRPSKSGRSFGRSTPWYQRPPP